MTYHGRKIEWDVFFAWIFILIIGFGTFYAMLQYTWDAIKWLLGGL